MCFLDNLTKRKGSLFAFNFQPIWFSQFVFKAFDIWTQATKMTSQYKCWNKWQDDFPQDKA
jgi:hypothetical protein